MPEKRSVDRIALDEVLVEPWLPHDCPERRFDGGTWIDDCHACLIALRAEARSRPRLVLCLKTHADRILVTAEYAVEILMAGRSLDDLCYVPGDAVREVFVALAARVRSPGRWWSLAASVENARTPTAGCVARVQRSRDTASLGSPR